MEPLTIILIFVLIAVITFFIVDYYRKKEDDTSNNVVVNYDILNQLVQAYGPNVSIRKTSGLSYVDFGVDASGNDLNKVVNNFMDNVSQKVCKKDASFEFPVAYSERNQLVISRNLGSYLDKLSILTISVMEKAKTKKDMDDCKNILSVLSYITLKSEQDFKGKNFIQWFPSTNRINVINDDVKKVLFGNDYEYSPNLMEYSFFKELLYNSNYNQTKLENYVNYKVADAKFENNKNISGAEFFNQKFEEIFKQNLKPIYDDMCINPTTKVESQSDECKAFKEYFDAPTDERNLKFSNVFLNNLNYVALDVCGISNSDECTKLISYIDPTAINIETPAVIEEIDIEEVTSKATEDFNQLVENSSC